MLANKFEAGAGVLAADAALDAAEPKTLSAGAFVVVAGVVDVALLEPPSPEKRLLDDWLGAAPNNGGAAADVVVEEGAAGAELAWAPKRLPGVEAGF